MYLISINIQTVNPDLSLYLIINNQAVNPSLSLYLINNQTFNPDLSL